MNILKIIFVILLFIKSNVYAESIEDNSFLVEEAYNQEPGVVQFINVYQKAKNNEDWTYVFINEIPVFSQKHQFSYEIPYIKLETSENPEIGDIKINYRNELLRNETIVSTGRISITNPTGDPKKGLGNGTNTFEISLLSSIKLTEKFIQHWNLGMSYASKAKNSAGETADNGRYFWNLSNVYLITDKFNFMLESTSAIEETTIGTDLTSWSSNFILSPSFRYAFEIGSWQIVPGVAFPTNLGQDAGSENQILSYLSIEGQIF